MCFADSGELANVGTFKLSAMITILTLYAAISGIFSLGFVAGAWWGTRARINEVASPKVETFDQEHDRATVLILQRRHLKATA